MQRLFFLIFILLVSCQKNVFDNPIEYALNSNSESIQSVVSAIEDYEVQIKITDANGTDFNYQVNDSMYFYPASSVKLPIAILALEKANAVATIDSDTDFLVDSDSIKTTIRNEVRKIFAVSDNDAYNRLFEFLGQDYINTKLIEKGINPVQISHRLSTDNAANTTTKGITFYRNDTIVFYQEVLQNKSIKKLNIERTLKGKGFYRKDSLISKPMDFSQKNYLPISTLHEITKRIHFPENYEPSAQFNLSKTDLLFLKEVMHKTPKQQGFNQSEYYDSYVKFFMFGDTKTPIPHHIKMYNKVGYAYGYLTDSAYIVDEKHQLSFIITATIHVNKNQLFNDDTYEYDTIGIPFLSELGRKVHEFYINQQKRNR